MHQLLPFYTLFYKSNYKYKPVQDNIVHNLKQIHDLYFSQALTKQKHYQTKTPALQRVKNVMTYTTSMRVFNAQV